MGIKQKENVVLEEIKIKYCLYARKSTESEERQILSIDSQIKEMLELAKSEGLDIIEIKRESHSAKETGMRPVFNEMIEDIKQKKFNGILTWAPDRISRNAGDLGKVVDLMDNGLLQEIRTSSQKFSNNPNEKFLLMILGSQAKLENDNKGINVKRGLKTRVEMGLWPCVAPTGYMNDRTPGNECQVVVDPYRGPIIKQMFEKVAYERWSGRTIHKWLKHDIKFRSRRNKDLGLATIYTILRTPFYTGVFEYPRGSGNWYQGKHKPIITQEIFQIVQEKINEENKPKSKFKEFTFVKMMMCGYCGSGVTAQEKSKNISDGSVHWYIYYSCTRHKDHHCKNPYIREDSIIAQLDTIIDDLDINELGARHIIEKEVERHNKLRATVLGKQKEDKIQDIDVKAYAKYLLREGTIYEKRELLSNLKNRIVIKDKKISLEKN